MACDPQGLGVDRNGRENSASGSAEVCRRNARFLIAADDDDEYSTDLRHWSTTVPDSQGIAESATEVKYRVTVGTGEPRGFYRVGVRVP